jgi:acyl-CoA synthetase (AMP-forming)/AMP-acid ligase II
MHVATLVEMIESGLGDRVLLGAGADALTGEQLADFARRGAGLASHHQALVYAGENHPHLPVLLLAASLAGIPFVPVNYRLEDDQLVALLDRQPDALVIADERTAIRLRGRGRDVTEVAAWLAEVATAEPMTEPADDDDAVAIVLYTSGTTAAPKAALLRHRHLMAYLFGTVEYAGADEDEAVLVSVPPYHIAGVANLLSNLFSGRRLVYLESFTPQLWLQAATSEKITHAMVVPTMLARIVDTIEQGASAPQLLRSLSYGGSKIATSVIERALLALPTTGFVNAYGLTETASTIAILGPEDHRAAVASDDPVARRRLGSAGQVVPTVEIEIRDESGEVLAAGESGVLYLRGEQIAGEYATGSLLDSDGWFCTRDSAWVDDEGYLFIEGRVDDTIIRGGENIAPAEIEDVLQSHAAVEDVCVVGVPDEEWGQRIWAAVVLRTGTSVDGEALRDLVRSRLRGAKTPDVIVFADELPRTSTGKIIRRTVLDEIINPVRSTQPS